MPVVSDYTALLSGNYWNGIEVTGKPVIVTYSFPTAAPAYMAGVDGFTASTVSSFQAFNSAEQAQARAALGEWAAASGLIFIQVAPGKGDINFQLVDFNTTSGPSYAGAGGIAFYPFGNWDYFSYPSFSSGLTGSGDVFMNTQLVSGGVVNYGTLLHEIGHAIGLKHPTEVVTDFAANPPVTHDQVLASDDPSLTIMAQAGNSGTGDHLKTLDQQAAAFLYGSAGTGRVVTGNASGSNSTVSSWSWNNRKQTLTQSGFAGDDTLRGSSVTDVISGLDGNDRLFGLNGNDTLNGGAGNDLLDGGPGIDTMKGSTGDDTYRVDNAKDKVIELAGEGFDTVLATVSHTLAANVELLQLFGLGLSGHGNGLDNTMYGDGTRGTKLYGLDGSDYMVGGSGRDTLDGGTGIDLMYGQAGDDTYYVDNASDQVSEAVGGGADTVNASASWSMAAGQQIETLKAYGAGATSGITLAGNEFNNTVIGGSGNDTLSGGGGNDNLNGGAGDDVLAGGLGTDKLTGGTGNDAFRFDTALGSNVDTIVDFSTTGDSIMLSNAVFTGLSLGVLSPSAFALDTATGSSAQVVYNHNTGALLYDTNGATSGGSTQFAIVTGKPTLNNTYFTVYSPT